MYSKEEAKNRRQLFWTMFGKRYHRKWLLYDTKLKDVVLKFSFEDRRAMVSIDVNHEDEVFRAYYYEKLLSLKNIMIEQVSTELIFDENYLLESGKMISRVFVMHEGVKIQKQTDWPIVYEFYNNYMDKMEAFFLEYKDFIES
ncbi:MAG: DUF4268 domain-containing protein [Nonlabens sp.]|jgi:hypothetical protein|uniref:DUF4268 domain-containing protein n=1 Tax=Nonlabens sp. TaxID=1888209 RepID=UPI0035A5F417